MTSRQHPSFYEKLAHAREVLCAAGEAGAPIKETTPALGGLRAKQVKVLVELGEAEWMVPGERARLLSAVLPSEGNKGE